MVEIRIIGVGCLAIDLIELAFYPRQVVAIEFGEIFIIDKIEKIAGRYIEFWAPFVGVIDTESVGLADAALLASRKSFVVVAAPTITTAATAATSASPAA